MGCSLAVQQTYGACLWLLASQLLSAAVNLSRLHDNLSKAAAVAGGLGLACWQTAHPELLLHAASERQLLWQGDEDDIEALERDISEESGWKLVHGDVFRPPPHLPVLCALVGTGVQLALLVLSTILITIAGALSCPLCARERAASRRAAEWHLGSICPCCVRWWAPSSSLQQLALLVLSTILITIADTLILQGLQPAQIHCSTALVILEHVDVQPAWPPLTSAKSLGVQPCPYAAYNSTGRETAVQG